MSAGLMNLGMGFGFSPQRQQSQVVDSEEQYRGGWDNWLSNWNSNYQNRSTPIAPTYTPGRDEAIQSFVSQYAPGLGVADLASRAFGAGAGNDGLGGYVDAAANMLGGMDAFNRIDNMGAGSYSGGYTPDPAELARLQSEKATAETRRNQIMAGQQAYNQQTGGGFTGGIINDTYSQPFSSTITGGTAPSTGFGNGMMGQNPAMGAGQVAAPSTGLAQTGPGAAAPAMGFNSPPGLQADPNAWGGPFSNKNPWSLS